MNEDFRMGSRASWIAGLVAQVAVLSIAAGAAAGEVDGIDDEWDHVPTMGSGTAGYRDGQWAYEDYVYDSSAGSSGNAGDVAVVQVMLDDDERPLSKPRVRPGNGGD